MPNPKLGSVSDDIKTSCYIDAKSGQVEIRNDKDGNIGVSIGKKIISQRSIVKKLSCNLRFTGKRKNKYIY